MLQRNKSECELSDISFLLISPQFLLFIFNVWGLWVLLAQTGDPLLLLGGNLFLTKQQLLDICRTQETKRQMLGRQKKVKIRLIFSQILERTGNPTLFH